MKPRCNHVDVIKGPCTLDYGHLEEHAWQYPERTREVKPTDQHAAEEDTLP